MTKAGDGDGESYIRDDRVKMKAEGEAQLYVDTPDETPLSVKEPHATLRVHGDEWWTAVELDAEGLDALVDALYHAQEEHRDD